MRQPLYGRPIFYSRRIGAAPRGPAEGAYVDYPRAAPTDPVMVPGPAERGRHAGRGPSSSPSLVASATSEHLGSELKRRHRGPLRVR